MIARAATLHNVKNFCIRVDSRVPIALVNPSSTVNNNNIIYQNMNFE